MELKPNLVAAHLSLARVSMIRGDYAGAIVEATEAQKYAPRLVPAMELEAAAQAGQGAWNLAVDIREKIRAVAPENISNLVVLAALYRQQHSPEKSEKVFADAYQRAPDNGELVQRFAEFYVQTGRPEKATVLLEEHVKRNPDKAGAWLLRGEFAVKTSGVTEADTFYRKAAELTPDDPRPLLMLGDQYGQAKQWDAALKAYQEAGKKAKDKDTSVVDLRMADIYMLKGKGELDTAWKIVNELLRKDPKNAQAMVVGGRILARKDELAKATDLLQKAVETAPTYGEAKFRLARMVMSSDPMKALDLLGAVDPTDTAYERAMILKASIDNRRGLQKEAILDLRQLLDFRPTSQEAQTLLATLYLAVKDPARAVQVIDAMLTNRPGDPSLMVFLGDALYEKKDYREAMAQYSRARMLKPDLPTALIGEARCLVSLNRKADALKLVFDVMNRLDPKETWPRLALVSIYEMTDELPKAVETLIVGIQADPKWETGRMRLSDIFVRARKLPEARQVLDDGLRLVPDSLPLRTDLARVELALGRAEVARQLLEPVGRKYEAEKAQNPDEGERLGQYIAPLGAYSLSLYRLGRIPEAIKWAQVVWDLAPTDVANSNNLAWMLATEQKKLAEATDLVRRCLRLMPNNPQVLDTAGWIAYLRGDLEQSIELLTQSIKQGDNADARFHLGQAYQARERMEDAAEQYKESLKLGLAGKEAETAKRELRKMGKG